MELELPPVGLDQFPERVLVPRPGLAKQFLAHRRTPIWLSWLARITSNDTARPRKSVGELVAIGLVAGGPGPTVPFLAGPVSQRAEPQYGQGSKQ